ncbi:MAG: DUF402 domain-containing protein, partial [Acidimicrobiales bacterium]|nr:DUF402 domain-containing protein [Acidimicrobiales bacterium]
FHPDEDTVRVFGIPSPGVLRLDEEVTVMEVAYDDVVLRHYAFADRWFKINVTTDRQGRLIETGDEIHRFAFNCDISTPMERNGDSIFGVDLFIDVLVGADASSFYVGDEDEFERMAVQNLMSPAEHSAAKAALSELLGLVEERRLLPWLNELLPFGPCQPPVPPPMERREVPQRMKPFLRPTW